MSSEEVVLSTDGKRILANIPWFDGQGPAMAKSVPGRRAKWDESVKPHRFMYWTYPLSMDTCRALRRVFGAALVIREPLLLWAKQQRENETVMEDARQGYAGDFTRLPDLAPQLYMAMDARPYQLTGAQFITTAQSAILGDKPGLGKTIQALGALIEHGSHDILVVCPRTLCRTVWETETNRWTDIATFVAQGSPGERSHAMKMYGEHDGQRMLIINPEMLQTRRVEVTIGDKKKTQYNPKWPWLMKQQWDAIVMDESHKILATTKNTMSKHISQGRMGAMLIRKRLRPGGLALPMSGTAFRSDLRRAWGTLNWIRPDVFTSFWQWAETHFEVIKPEQSGDRGTYISPQPVNEEAFNLSLRPYFLARAKEDVAQDLPPIAYAGTPLPDHGEGSDQNYVQIDMTPEQERCYREMVEDAEVDLEGGTITAEGVLAEITRCRQFAISSGKVDDNDKWQPALPSNKLDWILQFLSENEGNPGKVLIASSFTRWINLLADEIKAAGYPVLKLTGETSDRDRVRNQKLFQDPDSEYRVFIINTTAGGVGITLDQADYMIFTDLPWRADEEEQATDRIHRVSRIHNVTVYRLLSKGTREIWIAGLTDEQRALLRIAGPEAQKLLNEARKIPEKGFQHSHRAV